MAQVVRRESREERGFFGQLSLLIFLAFNALMILWLFSYWANVGASLTTGSEAARTGAAVGTTIGTGFILFLWLTGAVITGFLAMLTRGKKTYVEISEGAVASESGKRKISEGAVASESGKKCPMCAETVHPEAKICRFCGHVFAEPKPEVLVAHGDLKDGWSEHARTIAKLPVGTSVEVIGRNGSWLHVKVPDLNTSGWLHSS